MGLNLSGKEKDSDPDISYNHLINNDKSIADFEFKPSFVEENVSGTLHFEPEP